MHPFSLLGLDFNLNKDTFFKLNNKYEFAQLGMLNIVLDMQKAF